MTEVAVIPQVDKYENQAKVEVNLKGMMRIKFL